MGIKLLPWYLCFALYLVILTSDASTVESASFLASVIPYRLPSKGPSMAVHGEMAGKALSCRPAFHIGCAFR